MPPFGQVQNIRYIALFLPRSTLYLPVIHQDIVYRIAGLGHNCRVGLAGPAELLKILGHVPPGIRCHLLKLPAFHGVGPVEHVQQEGF